MKLNPDCIRDLLIVIEENTDLQTSIDFDFRSPCEGRLSHYSPNQLAYHLKQCDLHGYLNECRDYGGDEFTVSYLSPAGHKFLADVRSDSVWSHTKSIAGKVGAWSLDTISSIASSVISELIKTQISSFAKKAP